MVPTICLLTCALAAGQPPDRGDWLLTPQLARGQELVYSGSFVEEALSPGVQFQRSYRIDSTVLVLDAKQDKFDLAVLTLVTTKTSKTPQQATLKVESVGTATMRRLSDSQPVTFAEGTHAENLAAYEEKVYLLGPVPGAPGVK